MCSNSNSIFRVRPITDHTLDELKNSYLWFSRPVGFKGDYNDANIGAFVTDTPAIARGFKFADPDFPFEQWYDGMSHTGICCFTRRLPSVNRIKKFPGCKNGKAICIEYNKDVLEQFFNKHRQHPIAPCFRKVQYAKNPTKLDSCDEWSILWEVCDGYKVYKTIPGILHEHPRVLDEFIFRLLTRISSRFKKQAEERIILGRCFIPTHDSNVSGYRISIPDQAIKKIYIYPNGFQKNRLALSNMVGLNEDMIVFL